MTSGLFVNVRAEMNGLPYSPAGVIFAVDGTAYPGAPVPPTPLTDDGNGFWAGFASGIVGGLINEQDGLWASVCVGYPAVTFPMWPSVQIGRANLNTAIVNYANNYRALHGSYDGLVILLAGYSQGAMVVCETLFQDILIDGGALSYLAPHVYRAYLFGDPMRCPGIAYGQTEIFGGTLPPNVDGQVTGGIAGPLDYTAAQANLLAPDGRHIVNSFVLPGDLYADSPCGPNPSKESNVGKVETGIFNIVMNATFIDVVAIAADLVIPVATVEGIINAGSFFAQGTGAAHYQYYPQMTAAINDALALGNTLPHQPGY